MILSGFIEEDFVNYKKPSMLIGFPNCSFKCGRWCQNYSLKNSKRIKYDENELVERFIKNPFTEAIVFGGLEPFDDFSLMKDLIKKIRGKTDAEIVIYTGYTEQEIEKEIKDIKKITKNVIVKFGRYIPDQESHYDELLGVDLMSKNQYAKQIC